MESTGKKETRDQEMQTEIMKKDTVRRTATDRFSGGKTMANAFSIIQKLTRIQHMLIRQLKLNSNLSPN